MGCSLSSAALQSSEMWGKGVTCERSQRRFEAEGHTHVKFRSAELQPVSCLQQPLPSAEHFQTTLPISPLQMFAGNCCAMVAGG